MGCGRAPSPKDLLRICSVYQSCIARPRETGQRCPGICTGTDLGPTGLRLRQLLLWGEGEGQGTWHRGCRMGEGVRGISAGRLTDPRMFASVQD